MVAHVGFAVGSQPYVIPFSYYFDPATPARLYLHGGTGSRALRHLASGAEVCITVTLLDGLVYSRTALNHSMNYRSVVAFGRASSVASRAEKERIFEQMIRRYFPGRTVGRDYQAASPEQLDATELLTIDLQELSAKVRSGGPTGPLDGALEAPGNCGVVEPPPLGLNVE